ncbi:hypothetical protein S83_058802, partial [Arachis hypogaea]
YCVRFCVFKVYYLQRQILYQKIGCLGALDEIYIDVTVLKNDKSRYRIRKSRISTNVLEVCNRNINFVYVLSGWEGSASDSRVLRDAITRHNGLKLPV